jgi:hypothetical protein
MSFNLEVVSKPAIRPEAKAGRSLTGGFETTSWTYTEFKREIQYD